MDNKSLDAENRTNEIPKLVWTLEWSLQRLSVFDKVVLTSLCILFFIGTAGNSCVVFTFGKKNKRNLFERRLLLLAVIDLFSSIFVPSLFIYGTITKFYAPHLGVVGCKILISLFPISVTISQSVLIFISYERYNRIERPFEGPKRIRFWFAISLVIAVLLVFPYTWTLGENCLTRNIKLQNTYVIFNLLRDFFAVIFMLYFNIQTARSLKNNGDVYSNVSKTIRQKTKKISRTLLVMVTVFTICVVPVDIFQFVVLNLMTGRPAYINPVNTSLVVLQMCNSIANVIIYSVTDDKFRSEFLKMIKMLLSSRRSSSSSKSDDNSKNFSTFRDIEGSQFIQSSMSFLI